MGSPLSAACPNAHLLCCLSHTLQAQIRLLRTNGFTSPNKAMPPDALRHMRVGVREQLEGPLVWVGPESVMTVSEESDSEGC